MQAVYERCSRPPVRGRLGNLRFFVPSLERESRGLAHRVEAHREGWRSRLLGLSSPAHTPTRTSPHGISKHNRNDRLGQSFTRGCSAPLDPLRRTEEVCGRLFLWHSWGLCPLGLRRGGGGSRWSNATRDAPGRPTRQTQVRTPWLQSTGSAIGRACQTSLDGGLPPWSYRHSRRRPRLS